MVTIQGNILQGWIAFKGGGCAIIEGFKKGAECGLTDHSLGVIVKYYVIAGINRVKNWTELQVRKHSQVVID